MAIVAEELNYDGLEEMVAAVGYAHVTPRRVLNRLYAVLHPDSAISAPPAPTVKESREAARAQGVGVSVAGVDGVLMRVAKCCDPVPGDPIIGYISRGLGITVHRADCPNTANMEPERLISVHWEGEEEKPYEARIFIIARNVTGVLAAVTGLMSKDNINITGLNLDTQVDGRASLRFKVEVRNATQLYQIIEKIRALPDILEVVRDTEA